MAWMRSDGRPIGADQVQFRQSQVECKGTAAAAAAGSPQAAAPNLTMVALAERQRRDTMDSVMQACMSQRGYFWVQVPNS